MAQSTLALRDPLGQAAVGSAGAPKPTLVAIQGALTLGGSLFFTWGIALAIRLLVPRYLGPSRFGTLSFADAFAATFFVILSFGSDAYIRKEVPVRPSHASDFIGGTVLLRLLVTGCIFGAMSIVLWASNRPAEVRHLVLLFGVTQFFVTANATLSALLHAKGRVGAMSVLAVVTKVIWALGVLAALVAHAGLWAYAASYLASESVETVVLYRLAQKHVGLVFRVDRAATRTMLLASLPYYLTIFATTAYGKLDVSLLEFLGDSQEVGWYGAASAVAGLALLVAPLISWVLMPMFARAVARSRDEFYEQIRRSMELILTVAIPASLMIALGAPVWIRTIFGVAFVPAAPALRVLATMCVLTYVAIVYAQTLIMLGRGWALTKISLVGLIVNIVLNLVIIRRSMLIFGVGGGGTGCAIAMLGTEVFVTSCMIVIVGRDAFDRGSVVTIGKSLAACGVVALAHRGLSSLGPARLALDALIYLVIVLSTGALKPLAIARVIQESIHARGGRNPGAARAPTN
jgi:O-antigen/teichoic acid export membrane protein